MAAVVAVWSCYSSAIRTLAGPLGRLSSRIRRDCSRSSERSTTSGTRHPCSDSWWHRSSSFAVLRRRLRPRSCRCSYSTRMARIPSACCCPLIVANARQHSLALGHRSTSSSSVVCVVCVVCVVRNLHKDHRKSLEGFRISTVLSHGGLILSQRCTGDEEREYEGLVDFLDSIEAVSK